MPPSLGRLSSVMGELAIAELVIAVALEEDVVSALHRRIRGVAGPTNRQDIQFARQSAPRRAKYRRRAGRLIRPFVTMMMLGHQIIEQRTPIGIAGKTRDL
jgi:hypothetical protein